MTKFLTKNLYKKETGLDATMNHNGLNIPTPEYIEWLEKTVELTHKPQIINLMNIKNR